jgi:hypothetical protein
MNNPAGENLEAVTSEKIKFWLNFSMVLGITAAALPIAVMTIATIGNLFIILLAALVAAYWIGVFATIKLNVLVAKAKKLDQALLDRAQIEKAKTISVVGYVIAGLMFLPVILVTLILLVNVSSLLSMS